MRLKKFILACLFLFPFTFTNGQVAKLQSVFIYNFTKYIDWPASYAGGDFVIGVLGDSPIITELNNMASQRKVGNQAIEVKKFNSPSEITKCHILFIPANQSENFDQAKQKIGNNNFSTLLITEKEGMASQGAAINFVIRNNKQKFELKASNASQYGLQISSKLEALAINL